MENGHGEPPLDGLEKRFLQAIEARARKDIDTAAELLRSILKVEPRLAEPRLELAHILLETNQLAEAEDHAREAISSLEAGGRWTEDLDDSQLLSLAWGTLGEILRTRADSDEVVFGTAEVYTGLVEESQRCFERALALDADNEHARAWSRVLATDPKASGSSEE